MIRCIECSPPLDLESTEQGVRHFQAQHWELLVGMSQYEQADAMHKALRMVVQSGSIDASEVVPY